MRNLLIFTVGFVLPFFAGELWLQTVDPYHFGEKEDWSQYGAKTFDPQTGRLRAGARASYLQKETVISSQGWRSPEFAEQKPDGVFRILVLGGSVPYGWGVAQGDEFPRVLERRLNELRPAGDKRIEVINTGVPGWSIYRVGQFLLQEGLAWQPDMVLLCLVATDVRMNREVQRLPILNDEIRRVRMARALENRYMFNSPGTQAKPYDAYARFSDEGLQEVGGWLFEFEKVCRQAGAKFVVFDTLGENAIRNKCEELGMYRIEGYTSWPRRRSWEVALTDAHPNATGHRYLAEMILKGLELKSLWTGR